MSPKVKHIADKIIPILQQYRIRKAGVFGSVVRGEDAKNSDVDLLVQTDEKTSLLEFVHIKHELEDILGRKVDLVDYRGLRPALKEKILREEVSIL
jgi:predicted nucleotidyltransferase